MILQNGRLGARQFQGLPTDLFGFFNADDYASGPLADWPDPRAFVAARAGHLEKIGALDLPDGSLIDYTTWAQFLPWYDWRVEDPRVEWPHFREFDAVIGSAKDIEIWVDETRLSGRLFFWSTCAALAREGIGPGRVRVCRFPRFGSDIKERTFWEPLYLDQPGRAYPAEAIPEADWTQRIALWEAICALPAAPSAEVLACAADDFALMQGRFPDAEGMNNIRWRLLRVTPEDWRKMARVVGDAMCAGWDVGDDVRDIGLKHELEAMAQLPEPLVEVKGQGAMRFCEVRLTQAGRALQAR